jgi:hypothetical protein
MRIVFVSSYCLLLCLCGYAQSIKPDTAFVQTALRNSINVYTQSIGAQANLYNGSAYLAPFQTNSDHPYFETEEWVNGSVIYEGEPYENLDLLYDISNDRLITELYNGSPIMLINEKLNSFSIGSHHFKKIKNETVNNSLPQSGFYEILYDGTTQAVARRQKKRRETIESKTIQVYFDDKDKYFILKNGNFNQVKSKTSVLKLFPDHKQALKQYMRKNNLNYKTNRSAAIAGVVEYYDTLTLVK